MKKIIEIIKELFSSSGYNAVVLNKEKILAIKAKEEEYYEVMKIKE